MWYLIGFVLVFLALLVINIKQYGVRKGVVQTFGLLIIGVFSIALLHLIGDWFAIVIAGVLLLIALLI